MRRKDVPSIFIFFALTVAACAQVRGPIMGYLPEKGALRILNGIPGAGSVSAPHLSDRTLSLIEVSPDQTRALAIAADTGALVSLTPGAVSTALIDGAAPAADRITFSPNGTAAALWFSAAHHIQVVSGLSGTPLVRDLDASSLGADPLSFAVSDDGQWVAGAWSDRVYAFGPDGNVSILPVDGPAEAVCFFHGRADVAVITVNQVVIVANIDGAAVPSVIWTRPSDAPPADPATPLEVAVGFATSFDNRYLTIAGSLSHLATFDLVAGTSIGGDCACLPKGLFGMGGSLFRLTGLTDGAVKIFDASTNDVWLVPLAAAPSEGAQQ